MNKNTIKTIIRIVLAITGFVLIYLAGFFAGREVLPIWETSIMTISAIYIVYDSFRGLFN